MQLAILCGIVILPLALLILLRTNAAVAFFALCSGAVLQNYTTRDVLSKVNTSLADSLSSPYASILIILLPFILAVLLLLKTVKKSKISLHIVPAVCTGLVALALITPYFPTGSTFATISKQEAYIHIHDYQAAVIVVGILSSLLIFALKRPKKEDKKHAHHH